jgi:hypothetical protein
MAGLAVVMAVLAIVMADPAIVMAGLDPAIPARTVRNRLGAHGL